MLTEAVNRVAEEGLLEDTVDPGVATMTAWSAVHGLVSLIIDGVAGVRSDQHERAGDLAERVVARTVRSVALSERRSPISDGARRDAGVTNVGGASRRERPG